MIEETRTRENFEKIERPKVNSKRGLSGLMRRLALPTMVILVAVLAWRLSVSRPGKGEHEEDNGDEDQGEEDYDEEESEDNEDYDEDDYDYEDDWREGYFDDLY